MNNLKNLIFCSLIVGSQLEIHTAQESRKRKSERLEQVHCKKMIRAKETHDPAYQSYFEHVDAIVKNLPILDEGFQLVGKGKDGLTEFFYTHYPFHAKEETFEDNLDFMNQFPRIITQAEEVIENDTHMKTVFLDALWELMDSKHPEPKKALTEHKNPMVRYITEYSFFMRRITENWINESNHPAHAGSLLCVAARFNRINMIPMLIEDIGADVNVQYGRFKNTPLHFAIRNRSINAIKTLLTTPGINVHLKNTSDTEEPALHEIINRKKKDQKTILDIFIQTKADVNSQNKNGDTLLHLVTKHYNFNQDSALEKLITAPNVNVNIQNNQGKTALHYASLPLFCYASLSILIKAGAKLNIQDNNGDTPLHISSNTHPSLLQDGTKKLLESGADKNIKNNDGNTPLHLAVLKKCSGRVRYLLAAGADKTIKNNDNKTARELAETPAIIAVFAEFNGA